jgi:hypothetical protein
MVKELTIEHALHNNRIIQELLGHSSVKPPKYIPM